MNVLLTGGTGFLGSNLLKKLVVAGHHVVMIKRSFSNIARVKDMLPHVAVVDIDVTGLDAVVAHARHDLIVHCATDYGRKEGTPLKVIEANLMLPLRLLESSAAHGAPIFVNTDTILDKRINYYSLSKKQFKEWFAHHAGGRVCINVALEHFYGPLDDPSKFVTMMVQRLLRGDARVDLTLGEQRRDFIYIDDVVSAFMAIIGHSTSLDAGFHAYEVGSGANVAIRDFVTRIKSVVGNATTELRFGALPYRDNEVMESQVDVSALRALGWSPRIGLDDGLRATVAREREAMAL